MRIMAGMRTTGRLHIGHYFGALRSFLSLQKDYECFFGLMDWHAMTTAYKNTEEISLWTREIFAEFLAYGLDPEKNTLFVQSGVPEHLELYMIFGNLTPLGWLERVPTWKDAEEEAKASDTYNLGRFGYPVLQAADIAIYHAQKVPVGADQVSHLELTREIVRRFNHLYKAEIPEPQPLLTETPLVPGLDGRNIRKSYHNGLDLTEEEVSLSKKIRGMPTDTQRVRREDRGEPLRCNVFTYHKLFSSEENLSWVIQGCRTAGIGCGDCKGCLVENVEKLVREPRQRKKELLSRPKKLDEIMAEGNLKARKVAGSNLRKMKEQMQLL